MTDLRLAPSILSADFARLADEVGEVSAVCDLLHVDVMDGHYVDNLTVGPTVVRWLREHTDLPFDTHLMIAEPRRWAPRFIDAGATSITFHPATDDDPADLVDRIHGWGAEAAIAVRPSETLDDVADLLPDLELVLCMTVEPGFGGQPFLPTGLANVAKAAALREEAGHAFRIEVDGGVNATTAARCVEAGADTLVAGSAIFDADDRVAAARRIVDAARSGLRAAG